LSNDFRYLVESLCRELMLLQSHSVLHVPVARIRGCTIVYTSIYVIKFISIYNFIQPIAARAKSERVRMSLKSPVISHKITHPRLECQLFRDHAGNCAARDNKTLVPFRFSLIPFLASGRPRGFSRAFSDITRYKFRPYAYG